jgi:alpha-glucosidase
MRLHGGFESSEKRPWKFGGAAETTARKFTKLRYALVPYIYSLYYQLHSKAVAPCRPMYYDSPGEDNAYSHQYQYMFGDYFLAAPVTSLNNTKEIWVPEGKWINYFTGEIVEGPKVMSYNCPLDIMPLYVKAGAVIPMQPDMGRTDERPLDTLIVDLYPGSGEFTLYEDDGKTEGYQTGAFALTELSQVLTGSAAEPMLIVDIGESQGTFPGKVVNRTYLAQINHLTEKPSAVSVDNSPAAEKTSLPALRSGTGEGFFYDAGAKKLLVQIPGTTDMAYRLQVEGVSLDYAGEITGVRPAGFSLRCPEQWRIYGRGGMPVIDLELAEKTNVRASIYASNGAAMGSVNPVECLAGRHLLPVKLNGDKGLPEGNYVVQLTTGGLIISRQFTWINNSGK